MGIVLVSQPFWPAIFSYQDKIDPVGLANSFDPLATTAVFNNKIVNIPQINPSILGDSDSIILPDNIVKRIEVDLTTQHLYGFENNRLVYDFVISSGKWDRTPQGTFAVWIKIRSQKMSGGSKELGTYYYLPNVPYILFFYNANVAKKIGYSLHGTYWHDNFGTPMSHGCINMKTAEVAQIFKWANVGTQITIYGKYKAPNKEISSR